MRGTINIFTNLVPVWKLLYILTPDWMSIFCQTLPVFYHGSYWN